MPTNTSKATTVFSDLPHLEGLPMFPLATDIQAYLERYVEAFGLSEHLQLCASVSSVERRDDGSFAVTWRNGGVDHTVAAKGVVVATGRNNCPVIPTGLEAFSGRVMHAFDYPGREAFRGQTVMMVGNSISGLEIPTDLAKDPSIRVVSCCRKPRYIIQKTKDGVPSDWRFFNRVAAFASETLPPDLAAKGLKEMIMSLFGNPADHGALRPSDSMLEAGIGQAQDYLELCARGRILAKPMPVRFEGNEAVFDDGACEQIDVILLGTGYRLHLPFLSEELRDELNVGQSDLDLFDYTFAPTVAGLAFVGQYSQVGPYFPVLKLQGRYIARVFSGEHALPAEDERVRGAKAYRALRDAKVPVPYHEAVLHVARALGVEPRLEEVPELAAGIVFGPIVPSQFRLHGPGARPEAREELAAALKSVGHQVAPPVDEQQLGMLRGLASAPHPSPHLERALAVLETRGTAESEMVEEPAALPAALDGAEQAGSRPLPS
jgi:hypothetical protein